MAKDKEAEARAWFIGRARTAAGYRKKLVNNQERGRDSTVIGKMYFFAYDPKWKDTLPIYDKFPLVFPIERYSDGFLGLNLHYLSQAERANLLGKLMQYKSAINMSEKSRLRLSYDLISSTRRLASLSRPCIKRYLFGHVRSKFIEITPDEWPQAINLPVQFFVTKS